jgi:hypothetical protein
MTYYESEKAHVHYVHISPYFTSPEGEGFRPSPKGTLKGSKDLRIHGFEGSKITPAEISQISLDPLNPRPLESL